ncbi:MAG: prolipoprotein diacylglyceryl transferase family protein [Cyanobacteria bacterium J06635_15]
MEFPVYLPLGPWQLHPHRVFETLAYAIAFRLILKGKHKDSLPFTQRSSVLVGGLVGGLVGAKVLVMLQHINLLWESGWQAYVLLLAQGKTVVGALLGALIGVELTKKWIGVTRSTGDAFVYPLIVGMMVGRIGCFLTGLSDRTYGTPTTLPWGVDFGDGIARHPTQLYEIGFLGLLGLYLLWRSRPRNAPSHPLADGDRFKFFMVGYLSFRFCIDFIKPDFHALLGLSAIQIACVLGLIYYRHTLNPFLRLFE